MSDIHQRIEAVQLAHPWAVQHHIDGSRSWHCRCGCTSATQEGHAAHVAELLVRELGPMQATRWWRVVYKNRRKVWCETSDENEAREAITECPGGGGILQRYYTLELKEWRDEQ